MNEEIELRRNGGGDYLQQNDAVNRIKWLDIAKAFAVYLVLLGHIIRFNNCLFRIIFSFHMPAFIIFAGYTLKITNVNFKTFLIKKAKALLIPFFAFTLTGIILTELFPCPHVGMMRTPLKNLPFKNLLVGWPIYGHVGATWFLNALFWGSLMAFVLLKIYERNKTLGYLSFVSMFFCAYFIRKIMEKLGIPVVPFRLDSAMMFSVFIVIGYLLKKSKLLEKQYSLFETAAISLMGFVLCLMCGFKSNGYVNICDCIYANCGDYLIAAVAGTIGLIFFSKLIEKVPYLSFVLSDIGKNTLFIFALQAYSYNHLNFVINKLFNKNYIVGDIVEYGYSAFLALISTLLLYFIKKLIDFSIIKIKAPCKHKQIAK